MPKPPPSSVGNLGVAKFPTHDNCDPTVHVGLDDVPGRITLVTAIGRTITSRY